ncbi:ABC transporter ATP-binding protein [Pelagibacteraceae bacterium]|jgi:ABC-2 type transport system ATP-binding protein|nr:ABC transporter ATP-binding protein [Pelagibacteraceae bacterium]
MNNSIALEIKNIGKTYKLQDGNSLKALDDITFNVKQGEIFGLLGPNGAGKSTLINILGGTVIKSNGLVNVWGFDLDLNPRQVRASIGIVPQEVNVDPFFTPKKLLDIQAGMYGVAKKDRITDKILELTSLTDKADSYMRSLSGGMRRRLLLAKAMVHQPPILILDEPTAGVDVDLRQKLLENVKELNKQGVTIILTTHYLQEAEELCDRIAIINHGKIVALDKTENLLSEIHLKKIKFKVKNFKNIGDKLDDHLKIEYLKNNQISIKYDKTISNIEDIIFKIKEKGLEIEDIMTEDADLEDVFIKLTKNL